MWQVRQRSTSGSICWDTLGQSVGGGHMGVSPCHHWGTNQVHFSCTEPPEGCCFILPYRCVATRLGVYYISQTRVYVCATDISTQHGGTDWCRRTMYRHGR